MSKFEDGSYGSLPGIALIAKVLAGRCKMKYTRAAAGKGAIPDGQTPKTMPGCADYVMDAILAGVSNPVDGECQVTVQLRSDNVKEGFYCTNIVLFAEDPDEGEVPFTYLSLENEPEWIRPASSIVGKFATFDIIAAVGDVDAVTAVIDPDAIVTHTELDEAVAKVQSSVEALTDSLVSGVVGSPLATDDGDVICGDEGDELEAYRMIDLSAVSREILSAVAAHNESAGAHSTFLSM